MSSNQFQMNAIALKKERDQFKADVNKWRDEYFNLVKFANDFESKNERLETEIATLLLENQKLHERIAKLRVAMIKAKGYWIRSDDDAVEILEGALNDDVEDAK